MADGGVAGQQDKASTGIPARVQKRFEAFVPHQIDMVQIIEPGAAQGTVGHIETGGSDDVDRYAQTRSQAQNGSGVLRNVGLEQSQPHGTKVDL